MSRTSKFVSQDSCLYQVNSPFKRHQKKYYVPPNTHIMSLRDRVEKVVKEDIRPALKKDGGDIAIVDVDEREGVVKVQLLGACYGCPLASITLTMFVERYLRSKVPEVKKIVPV